MWSMTWSLKVSKLCNLRCRYCYEWDDLADPTRISLDQWRKILLAVRHYHAWQTQRLGEPGRTFLVWHGGEPLLLPQGYFEEVLALQRAYLTQDVLRHRTFVNALQTNLYALHEEQLDLFVREQFELGVSIDFVSGTRLTLGGQESEAQVLVNMDRVLARKIPVTGAVVLAGHTYARLKEIYEWFAIQGVSFRLIPLSDPPPTAPYADCVISDGRMVEALKDLFVYWIDHGAAIAVEPLSSALQTVLLHMTGLEQRAYNRRVDGERLLIVNTDGTIYPTMDRYGPDRSLGNLFDQSVEDIVNSHTYEASLCRHEQLIDQHCGGCTYRGACDNTPLVHMPYKPFLKRCRVFEELCRFIEDFLQQEGLYEEDLWELLNGQLPIKAWTPHPAFQSSSKLLESKRGMRKVGSCCTRVPSVASVPGLPLSLQAPAAGRA